MNNLTLAAILVALLGHDNFQIREEAEQKLKELGCAALPVLNYGAKSEDVEIATRSNRLRRIIWLDQIDRMEMPWIDCLTENKNSVGQMEWPDKSTTEYYYLTIAGRGGHDPSGPYWKSWREATRLLCKDLIHNGYSIENVKELLEAMWTKHNTFNVKTGRYEAPPEQIGAPIPQK